jgi:hypothetical protein
VSTRLRSGECCGLYFSQCKEDVDRACAYRSLARCRALQARQRPPPKRMPLALPWHTWHRMRFSCPHSTPCVVALYLGVIPLVLCCSASCLLVYGKKIAGYYDRVEHVNTTK